MTISYVTFVVGRTILQHVAVLCIYYLCRIALAQSRVPLPSISEIVDKIASRTLWKADLLEETGTGGATNLRSGTLAWTSVQMLVLLARRNLVGIATGALQITLTISALLIAFAAFVAIDYLWTVRLWRMQALA